MAFGLWQERSYGGGNHWAYFGTPLDRLVQSLGLWGLLALCAPPILATIIAFAKSHIFGGVVLALTCISLVGIVYFFFNHGAGLMNGR